MSEKESQRPKRRLSGAAIAWIVGVAVLALFVGQNTARIRIRFAVFSFTWPLWLYTLVMAALGAFVWFGVGLIRRRRGQH
jgi:uncharacterized integral membrane protein